MSEEDSGLPQWVQDLIDAVGDCMAALGPVTANAFLNDSEDPSRWEVFIGPDDEDGEGDASVNMLAFRALFDTVDTWVSDGESTEVVGTFRSLPVFVSVGWNIAGPDYVDSSEEESGNDPPPEEMN